MRGIRFHNVFSEADSAKACISQLIKYHSKNGGARPYYANGNGQLNSLTAVIKAAEQNGFRCGVHEVSYDTLRKEAFALGIVHWKQDYFVIVKKIDKHKVVVADPLKGEVSYNQAEFMSGWSNSGAATGKILVLNPVNTVDNDASPGTGFYFSFLFQYFSRYKRYIIQLFVGMLIGSILQLIFPFLTQAVVDIGIENQDIGFINMILLAQFMLFISTTVVDLIKGWLVLHIGTRVSISFISDFLVKILRLPVPFFDSKMLGDILQRVRDHKRIESFMTSTAVNFIFSVFNLVMFGVVLAIYSLKILLLFVFGSILYTGWVLLFLNRRRKLEAQRFVNSTTSETALIQLLTGIQEIKLYNLEQFKRWNWERIQARIFRVNVSSLSVDQYQETGANFIYQVSNITMTFIAARAVITGEMTLGMLLAIQYILGQLEAPVKSIIGFVSAAQESSIILERIHEIYAKQDEELLDSLKISTLPNGGAKVILKDVSFSYDANEANPVYALQNINMEINKGQKIAFVGTSGSGKTTLVNLLLKFHLPSKGEIRLDNIDLKSVSNSHWRDKCSAVLQNGVIFSDTVANNIAVGEDNIDRERLLEAARIANVQGFISKLSHGFETRIGPNGLGLSQGQKQRILIARAVYKNSDYIFFDEATNALDANNERLIMENLTATVADRTVIIVAHRLSTVKNADQIFVFDEGRIVESGDHFQLTEKKQKYYELVKNQLELGN